MRGNPTEYYRRAGSGSSVGAGVKIGAIRAEGIRDNNSGKWQHSDIRIHGIIVIICFCIVIIILICICFPNFSYLVKLMSIILSEGGGLFNN